MRAALRVRECWVAELGEEERRGQERSDERRGEERKGKQEAPVQTTG